MLYARSLFITLEMVACTSLCCSWRVLVPLLAPCLCTGVLPSCVLRIIPAQVLKQLQKRNYLTVAQFTVRFRSTQRYWVTNKQGEVVDGSKNE